MESYGNDMFLSQEGYASIDFTLLDRPSTSVASAPESTAALLPDSSFPSFDFLDNSGVDSFGGTLHAAEGTQFGGQGRPEASKDMDWRKEKAHHPSSTNMYIQGVGNQEPRLSSPQFQVPVSQENLSQQQSQLERRQNWPILNSNVLSADKRNEESNYVHHSSYDTDKANRARDNAAFDRPRNNDMVSTGMLSFMPLEAQPSDGRHTSRMALGARSPQKSPVLHNSVMDTQPRNHPLNLDSLLTGSSAAHIRANQATSAGDSGTPERSQSNAGSLDGTETQQGHNVGQGLNHGRNDTEGGENMESRVNYDFLGSQIHLKSQPQAGVQYRGARLQPGLDEMQAWKHQFTYQQYQELRRQQQTQQLEQEAQQQQSQQLVQQARQRFHLEQQARQQRAQQLEQQIRQEQVQQLMPHARQQQSQQLMLHVRQQQSQQLEQQARQQQVQQLEQQARQQQAQQLEQQARQQQAQQLEQQARQLQAQQLAQQARQQQAQQLEQQARQLQAQQLEHQARQLQAQQLEQQARQQQAQLLEHQARQQRARLLEQQARQQQALEQRALQQQAQQLDQHTRQQQAQQLDQNARQQQAQQLEQHARWQKQLQQVLAGDNQNMGNQFAPSLYSSSMHDTSAFVRSSSLMSHMGIESHTPTIVPGNLHRFNVGNVNRMPNGSPSLSGFPPEVLLSQDPNIAFQAMALMGAPMDPSVYGSVASMRDAAGQPLNSYPSPQGAVQQLADAPHNLASAANHLVVKPVAHTSGVVASVPGDHRTTSFDPTLTKIDGKQGTLNKSSFGHMFPQNQGVSNLLQGTPMSRTPQLQDFNLKQRSWNEDLGQKDSFQGVSSQVLGDSDAPSESGFNNFQPGGWPSLPANQVAPNLDDRNQSMSEGQYALQGAYQTENTDFLNSLAVNPQGGWSALMQSAVAESPSGDGDHDDWSGLNLHKTETTSGDSLHFHPNVKEPNIWNEQNAQVNNAMNGRSFSLFNDDSVQSVQALPQSNSEGRGHLGSKMEGIQHGNQIKIQSGPSSKLVQETAGHTSTWQDQNLYQHIDKSSNLHPYSNFESRQGNSWISHNREQVPSEGRLSSHHVNYDGSQQNNSLQNQGTFKSESHRMMSLTSKDQSVWNKNEAQETEQNNLFVNANKGYQENENENTESEQLGSCTEKTEGQMYQIRHEGNKGTGASFQSQDPKLNAYQNGQPLQQEELSTGIFSKHVIEDNLENSAGRSGQTLENKYQLDSSSNAILDSSAKNRVIGNTSGYRQSNSSQTWNLFPNSFTSPQRETHDRSKSHYGQNDSLFASQVTHKGDASQQPANHGSDNARNSPQKEDDLQSFGNHRGYSRLGKMSVGLEENSAYNMMRMLPGHLSQQTVANVTTNYQPAEGGIQDLSLRGASYLDSFGRNTPELMDFRHQNVARAFPSNSNVHMGEDALITKLPNDSREKEGGGYHKDISLGHTSTSSSFERTANMGSLNKQASLSSQNMLELLTKPEHMKENDALKGAVFVEQNASVELCESSSDVSLANFGHNKLSGPPQGFDLRLATSPQLLQILHGRSLQSSTPSQTVEALNDKQSHPLKEDGVQRSVDSATHQGLSSKLIEASITDGKSLHLTASAKPLNIPHELSATVSKENADDLKEKASCIVETDIHSLTHPQKTQYIQRTSVLGQLPLSTQSMVSHTVPENQSHVQGSMMCNNQLQGSQGVVIPRQLASTCNAITQSKASSVNAVIDKESEMQGSFPSSTRSFGQSSYPSDLLTQDGQNHKIMSLTGSFSGLRNSDQGLHESWSNSASQMPGASGRAQSAAFLKLLNAFKTNYANHQRLPMGVEKVFPSVFESFRPPSGGSDQSFLTRPDGQMKFGMVGKAAASAHNQTYVPHIFNSQQPASAEELSKQESLFHQMASERGESSGISAPQNSMMGLPVAVPTLPLQTSPLNSQLSMLHSQGQDPRNFLASKIQLNTPSIVSSLNSGLYPTNQDHMKSINGQDSQAIQHSTCPPIQQQSDSCSDGPVDSQASELSDAPRHQYVSANQIMSRTAIQNDFDKKAVKRYKITDAGNNGIDSNMSANSSDQLTNPHTGLEQYNVASTTRAVHELGALSVDTRMVTSSQGNKERSEAAFSQGMTAMIQRRLQNQGYNHLMYQSSQSSSGADDRNHVNSQYANSRSLQFGTDANQKFIAMRMAEMYKRLGEPGRQAALISKQMSHGRNAENLFPATGLATPATSYGSDSALKEFDSTGPAQNPADISLPPTKGNAMHQYQYYLSESNIEPSVTVLPKKRKKVASLLIPWHVEIVQAGGELPSTRDAEMAWAVATNRLTEKEEDEIDTYEEGTKPVARVKRRLKLTTQLMQQLIPPLPTAIIRGKASIEHENATYTLAKTALGDACKLVSTWRTDLGKDVENENLALRQLQKHTKFKGKPLQIAEGFMDRAKNLDDDFMRLDASLSITELRNATQDLDRLAITNRLVRHHGRNLPIEPVKTITEERDSSSDSSFCTRKQYPQRYVTAVPMPKNLPDGVLCYSL
ncbi:uncharacterized protein LOC131027165 isoform X2 [Cryptomeria japonica]|uniref:uncharacterized protein LOC131027165 isoform X2 n=1 Tax=Cryptomeria japonica TaxID=3369 RepID=UPI0027DA33CB|nr:uncharacterized protein LOC131027165 isoform X2 [Cryptomeria japonica]